MDKLDRNQHFFIGTGTSAREHGLYITSIDGSMEMVARGDVNLAIGHIAVSPDGLQVALGTRRRSKNILDRVQVYQLDEKPKPAFVRIMNSFHETRVSSLVFADDGLLVSGGYNGNIYLWNNQTPDAPPQILGAHQGHVTGLCALPGNRVASIGYFDDSVKIWDVTQKKLVVEHLDKIQELPQTRPLQYPPALCYTSHENALYVLKHDGRVMKYMENGTGEPSQCNFPFTGLVGAFAMVGQHSIVTDSGKRVLRAVDMQNGSEVFTLPMADKVDKIQPISDKLIAVLDKKRRLHLLQVTTEFTPVAAPQFQGGLSIGAFLSDTSVPIKRHEPGEIIIMLDRSLQEKNVRQFLERFLLLSQEVGEQSAWEQAKQLISGLRHSLFKLEIFITALKHCQAKSRHDVFELGQLLEQFEEPFLALKMYQTVGQVTNVNDAYYKAINRVQHFAQLTNPAYRDDLPPGKKTMEKVVQYWQEKIRIYELMNEQFDFPVLVKYSYSSLQQRLKKNKDIQDFFSVANAMNKGWQLNTVDVIEKTTESEGQPLALKSKEFMSFKDDTVNVEAVIFPSLETRMLSIHFYMKSPSCHELNKLLQGNHLELFEKEIRGKYKVLLNDNDEVINLID